MNVKWTNFKGFFKDSMLEISSVEHGEQWKIMVILPHTSVACYFDKDGMKEIIDWLQKNFEKDVKENKNV